MSVDLKKEPFRTFIGEIEGLLDDFMITEKANFKGYILSTKMKNSDVSKVKEWFSARLVQLDKDWPEGFGISKVKFNAYRRCFIEIETLCEQVLKLNKIRSPAAKEISPTKLLAKFVCCQSLPEFNLTSESKTKVLKANEVWAYNKKTRRLIRFVSAQGVKISVKGASLINFDEEKSQSKIIRKPELQLKQFHTMEHKDAVKAFASIKATPSKASGRFSEDVLILKVI